MTARVIVGDCLEQLRLLPSESVNCCVTSPPYWGLRNYKTAPLVFDAAPGCAHEWGESLRAFNANALPGPNGRCKNGDQDSAREGLKESGGSFCQSCGAWRGHLGLEPTPSLYVAHIVAVFAEVNRVLRHDGTLWLNLGDCYATGAGKVGAHPGGGEQGERWSGYRGGRAGAEGKHAYADGGAGVGPMTQPNRLPIPGLKPKDLVGIPWRAAFALQDDGWYLRSDIIWSKPNPMPESVTDRPTKAHEYLFLLSKSERYYYDSAAIAEPAVSADEARWDPGTDGLGGDDRNTGKSTRRFGKSGNTARKHGDERGRPDSHLGASIPWEGLTRNRRTVWTIATQPFKGAHFATFPPALIEPCILAGCPVDGTVLDPFGGAGTTGLVANRLGRNSILIELNPEYATMAEHRIYDDNPLFNGAAS